MLLALIVVVYVLVARLLFPDTVDVSGWASIMVTVLFLGGLIALLVGLILENLSILLLQGHGKPTFFEVDRSEDQLLRIWFETNGETP